MKIQSTNQKMNSKSSFRGPLDTALTNTLVTIETNPMVNAALVDVFSMVAPRTYVDTKKRNKYAGAETFFRELTGTFIVCLSSGFLAKGISHIYNKVVNSDIKINPNSWVSNDSLEILKEAWNKSNNKNEYIGKVLENVSGIDGKDTKRYRDIRWNKVNWYDDKKWKNLSWENPKFNNIEDSLKDEKSISNTLGTILEKDTTEKDAKQVLEILEHRIGNALNISDSVNVEIGDKKLSTTLHNLLRDTYDMGKNVFTSGVNIDSSIEKLRKMNKVKTLGALSVASTLGLTNQYINRRITKKRTGTDAFVGDLDYKKGKASSDKTSDKKNNSKSNIFGLKLLASGGIIGLAALVMKIKNPKDFIKKLEFTSAITSGNAIKTVYTATLVGRFMAAKDKTELRESATRDYLGFLNWLVFGGFVAKGVANLLDKGQKNLFNINKKGEGVKHWLNDISLKTHAEINSKGADFTKKNIWKLNLAETSGLAYSTIALGVLLPLLNIFITKKKGEKQNAQKL
ncbi:hypothetical protein KBA27_00970 [bacterium]|nr:hypothetical protein [bacterium]